MIDISRRSFIGASTVLMSGELLLSWNKLAGAQSLLSPEHPELIPEEVIFSVLKQTLDAASAAGASYAEVSFDRALGQRLSQKDDRVTGVKLNHYENIHVGVRVLVNGRWGHAASNQCEPDELIRLAQAAVRQGKANSKTKPRDMDWSTGAATTGRYITPGIDPFSIPLEEKIDFLNSWRTTVRDFRSPTISASFGDCLIVYNRTERGFVNTNDCRQYTITYDIEGTLPVGGAFKGMQPLSKPKGSRCRGLHWQQGGWEIIREAPPHEQIPELAELSAQGAMVGITPVDIGRYDVVCDAATTARILAETIVKSSELDRVIGYEANASGTSYLGPNPYDFLGTQVAGASMTISANRNLPKGLATIPWDAEGTPVKSFDLVRNGRLVDYLTNRELAPMLGDWYTKAGKTPGSNGCAVQRDSSNFPLTGMPNIALQPGPTGTDENALIQNVKRGYYLPDIPRIQTSFQGQDGYAIGEGREIVNGKLGNWVKLGIMFNTTELLKGAIGIGDARTRAEVPFGYFKGQPIQRISCTIEAMAMAFANVPVIDPARKA